MMSINSEVIIKDGQLENFRRVQGTTIPISPTELEVYPLGSWLWRGRGPSSPVGYIQLPNWEGRGNSKEGLGLGLGYVQNLSNTDLLPLDNMLKTYN